MVRLGTSAYWAIPSEKTTLNQLLAGRSSVQAIVIFVQQSLENGRSLPKPRQSIID
jgi:hypothetical protein